MSIEEVRSRIATLQARFEPSRVLGERPQQTLSTQPMRGSFGGLLAAQSGPVPQAAQYYQPQFEQAGARYGLEADLLAAVAWAESGFDPGAVSQAGALGLMQIMPGTADELGVDPRDPSQAIDGAARYLREQMERFGSLELALAAYNAGPGAVEQYGGVPPYAETTNYVAKVLARLEQLRNQR